MPLLVTSASGVNGNGHGTLLAFDSDGKPLGAFSDDGRIVDPRGLAVGPEQRLVFLNSADRDCPESGGIMPPWQTSVLDLRTPQIGARAMTRFSRCRPHSGP